MRQLRRAPWIGSIVVIAASAAIDAPHAIAAPADEAALALERVFEQPFAHARDEDLAAACTTGSRHAHVVAALLTLRDAPDASRLSRMVSFVDHASIAELRVLVEGAPRPIAAGYAQAASALAARREAACGALAAQFAACFEQPTAEALLLALARERDPAAPERDRTPAWSALARRGGKAAGHAALTELAEPGPLGAAARATVVGVADRLMAQARLEEAAKLLQDAAAKTPRDDALAIRAAAVIGLYLDRRGEARAALDAILARAAVDVTSPTLGKTVVEARLGLAALSLLDGDAPAALLELDRAATRFGEPREHRRERKVIWCRIELVRALVLLRDGDVDAAQKTFARTILRAPFEQDYCTFDDALTGSFGAAALLDLLRRGGEGEFAARYFDELTTALARMSEHSTIHLGIIEVDAPAGSSESVDDKTRVKSWQHLRCVEAWLAVGHAEEAQTRARRWIATLEGTEPWVNRWLLAELRAARAHALIDLNREREAAIELEAATTALNQLGELAVLAELDDAHDRAEEGAAPLRSPLREREAELIVERARLEHVAVNAAAADSLCAQAWRTDPVGDEVLLLCAAWSTDDALATRVLATVPAVAGHLAGLARVAAKHGRADDALDRLETLLAWTAYAPARVALERTAIARDPDLDALHGRARFDALVGTKD